MNFLTSRFSCTENPAARPSQLGFRELNRKDTVKEGVFIEQKIFREQEETSCPAQLLDFIDLRPSVLISSSLFLPHYKILPSILVISLEMFAGNDHDHG